MSDQADDRGDGAKMGIDIQSQTVTAKDLRADLKRYERRYKLSSERFVEAFRNGELNETDDFHDWSAVYAAWKLAVKKP